MTASEISDSLHQRLVDIFGTNTPFVQELYAQYLEKPESLSENWRVFFRALETGSLNLSALETAPPSNSSHSENGAHTAVANGVGTSPSPSAAPIGATHSSSASLMPLAPSYASLDELDLDPEDRLRPLSGSAALIAQNMERSLGVPTATSVRTVPVKALEENRLILNQHLQLIGRGKAAFTHFIAWAIIQALKRYPAMNAKYVLVGGRPYRIERKHIHFGLAVDIVRKDGTRSLVVPNIKYAEQLNFEQFFNAYNALIERARKNALEPDDFQGTTASLTNPGTIGTAMSVPRLMQGQSVIVAAGAIDYPAEFQGMSPQTLSQLGVSKVMTLTSTYDHRIIQGAESGEFLAYIHKLLLGEEGFYDEIFHALNVPHRPFRHTVDKSHLSFTGGLSTEDAVRKQARVMQLINSYRVRGHLIANINPLEYKPHYHPELEPDFYDLSIWDLDREFITTNFGDKPVMTLREILEKVRKAYCEKIGVEYMNIQSLEQKRWIQRHIENRSEQLQFSREDKIAIYKNLVRAEGFERYLHLKYLGHKRFSIEGGESAIAITDFIIREAAVYGVKEVVIGMAHRGRLNVLTNIVGKPFKTLFVEFEGKPLPMKADYLTQGSGDVKYHLGATGVRIGRNGKEIKVSVASNPSHLEAVNPVVEGIVRAKQDRMGDQKRNAIIPFLIHGDAAFAGQGVVTETLNLSQLEGYATGGTIHLIINNQIGFTTTPNEARSTLYATDVAKMVQAPIFHVNGDDPEACLIVAKLALNYRMTFNSDVVIDMLCYRRHGHNEGDDPGYTQPVMYRKIRNHPSVRELYEQQLIREGVLTPEEAKEMMEEFKRELDAASEYAKAISQERNTKPEAKADLPLAVDPREIVARYRGRSPNTGTTLESLQTVVRAMLTLPKGFNLNKKLEQQFARRAELLGENALEAPIDWAFAEALAFGTLLLEGYPVRLSGQDSTRGTFSQRHLSVFDMETGEEYTPLKHISPTQAPFYVNDSLLSEFAAMGFEFGYSVADPLTLTIWEAQFGDFANGAQIIIDQFISSTESKWGQPSGLVLLLPHGYEGQGPEHSSARLERFLQLCAEVNMQVVNCTTPAQYFHLLRRQVYAGNIKPLVVMTPKSLLRHPLVISKASELLEGKFRNVLDEIDPIEAPRRLIFCTGKIYYELLQERRRREQRDIAIVRIEQLYPFPEKRLSYLIEKYAAVQDVVWVQEEPKNMGAWSFIAPLLNELLQPHQKLRYVGRPASASPATGYIKQHEQEQAAIVHQALAE
ncbi:MAG: multifunctional oxoglutarate decarboxylase/oxoglutarate dehydrogenase thiamine pyrophosphate-binding subunit/dihydrolipoyllysine-residue succinyltransferase subunit [Chloroherpetonaceae bacterium]|nr:multifunctional oxoglutarate decarboxylase/oxoglutarate dehydrogenase thiamine pyrophosphate-binding subunit/dihydrolipoyllysine-residue succinyltransferase subunit [Chloroherpetonaceae bacterium]